MTFSQNVYNFLKSKNYFSSNACSSSEEAGLTVFCTNVDPVNMWQVYIESRMCYR